MRREEGLLHMQEASQEVAGAEDGALARASDGANAALLVNGGGPVQAPLHQRVREQALHREGMGSKSA
jgi:hypothetical protein